MPPHLSRSQHRGLVLVSAVILGVLFVFHWLGTRPTPAPLNAGEPSGEKWLIELSGAVHRPGLYSYERPPTLARVLEDGGGPTGVGIIPADQAEEVLQGETRLTLTAGPPKGLAIEKGPLSVRTLWLLGRPIPLNRATAEELDAIPGIGPGLARRIVDRRETQGPFSEVEELQQVSGVGEKTLEKVRPYLTAP